MNAAHCKTLLAIYSMPTPCTLAWRKIESLFLALGVQCVEGNGSRVRFERDGLVATFHRPNPQKEAKPYQVRGAKEFLTQLGVMP